MKKYNYDAQMKCELIEFSLESSLDAESKHGSGGWFREFSDFFDCSMGYGEL